MDRLFAKQEIHKTDNYEEIAWLVVGKMNTNGYYFCFINLAIIRSNKASVISDIYVMLKEINSFMLKEGGQV